MEKIDRLCEAILMFARGKEMGSGPMPRVSFHFEHDGSDLPELPESWRLVVTLRGVDHLEGDKPVLAYEEKWEGAGSTANEAFAEVLKQFRSGIQGRQFQLQGETAALVTTLRSLDDPDLRTMWASKDPEEQAAEDFKVLTGEATHPTT